MVTYYRVGFLNGDTVQEVVRVTARSAWKAYKQAEKEYRKNGWTFDYDDMYSEKIKLY